MEKSTVKNMRQMLFMLALTAIFFGSCSTDRKMTRKVGRLFNESEILHKHHLGFALYNISEKHMVFGRNSDKYFIPGSNLKLFTFYAALKMIPDSVPALRFIEKGDSLIFWGTGDPSFLQTKLKALNVFDFLKGTTKKLYYAPGRYTGEFYGKGWQWDDYNDSYQAEINELPILSNVLTVTSVNDKISVIPRLFNDCFVVDSSLKDTTFRVIRGFNTNKFRYPPVVPPATYLQQVPYKIDVATTISLLADTLGKKVEIIALKMPENARTRYSLKTDSVLKEMMQPSDNFIAEQLLLVYSNQIGQDLNSEKVIGHIERNYLTALPDQPRWIDGSGLSRYNLVTPRTMIKLLELIYDEVNNPVRLFELLAAGGKTGTLKDAYPKTDHPFVYGKTGSMSNNYNQSGYVLTKKGKTYIFAFMNNNFVSPAAEVRDEMVRIITYIHEQF